MMRFTFFVLDKTLLLMGRSIVRLFLLVKGYLASKTESKRYSWDSEYGAGAAFFKKTSRLLVESPVKKESPAFAGTSFANFFLTPFYGTFRDCPSSIHCAIGFDGDLFFAGI
jgi:hypothetical protein